MHAGNAALQTLQTLAQLSVKKTLLELSVKEYITAGFELVLAMLLAMSFFECPDESRRDEQELQVLYTMSWPPALLSAFIVYGHRVSPTYGPAPANFDRNLRRSRIFTSIYSLLFLIWDEDMAVKRGPALYVAAIFCACDMVRFELEISGVMDDNEEDDELERLAAAVGALANDLSGGASNDVTASKRGPLSDLHRLSSMDSGVVNMQKPSKQHKLERLSTESMSTDDFVEMVTPAPTGVPGSGGDTKTGGTGLESLETPTHTETLPSTATQESSGGPQTGSGKPGQSDGKPVIFEF